MREPGFILVVDGHEGQRLAISESLGRLGLRVAAASTGNEALAIAGAARPSVAVVDVRLPDLTGYEVCRELRERYGDEVGILFVSGDRTEPSDRVAGLLIGADDYLVKPLDPDELLARARRLLARTTRRAPLADARFARLTGREREVLLLLADGLTQMDIAERLAISPKTVGTHIQRTLEKLDVRSRAQAVAFVHREHLASRIETFE